jgi:hypothetical protein
MSIVMISESLLLKSTATDGRILRDRVLSGFGVRLNARKHTFLIATSVAISLLTPAQSILRLAIQMG